MSKFYCNICNEDVTLKDGKCPNCKTDWNKIMSEAENSSPTSLSKLRDDNYENSKKGKDYSFDEEALDKMNSSSESNKLYCEKCGSLVNENSSCCPICGAEFEEPVIITDDEINKTISYFIELGKILKYLLLGAGLIFIIAIFLFDDAYLTVIYIIFAIASIIESFFVEHQCKWKAYMLYTNKNKR